MAKSLGADWIEVDVKLSADGVPFLLHDATLDRTTDGEGPAASHAMADLSLRDAGSWFSPTFAGERLPTLRELIDLLSELAMQANLEIKPNPGEAAETTRTVIETLRAYWPEDKAPPLLSSFDLVSLETAASLAREIPRALLLDEIDDDYPRLLRELDCASLHIAHKCAEALHARGPYPENVPVLFYTVNSGERGKTLLDAGAASIISDAPERILAAIDQ